jgi:histidinol-phosphate phosphatase family protein
MAPPKQAVILAGGRGTRLRPLTDALPKPMIRFHGKPFLEYLLELLREQGIERVSLLLGYLADSVTEYFGDGSRFGLQIEYGIGTADDDTGTRLRSVRDRLDSRFLFMYCDNYWPLDLQALTEAYERSGARAMLTVYGNLDGYTRSNVAVARDRIVTYDKTRTQSGLSGVDIGFAILESSVLDLLPADGNPSFEAVVYPQLAGAGQLAAFVAEHRYYSVGSYERLALTDDFLLRRKTVLVDRDGTLNERMPRAHYVTDWSQWRWIPGARRALAALTRAGYRTIVITNQPGVARGALDDRTLEAIHQRMIGEAAAAGGTIDAIFACVHGWDDGCDCRKPKPGLLFEAQRRFNLDLSRVPFLGDDSRDGEAARAAGAPFLPVSDDTPISSVVARLLEGEHQLASAS